MANPLGYPDSKNIDKRYDMSQLAERWGPGDDGAITVDGATVTFNGLIQATNVTIINNGIYRVTDERHGTLYVQNTLYLGNFCELGAAYDAAHAGGAAKVGPGQGNDGAGEYYSSVMLFTGILHAQAGGGGAGGAGVGFEGGRFGYFWRLLSTDGLRQQHTADTRMAGNGNQPSGTSRPAWFDDLDYEDRFFYVGRTGTGAGGGGGAGGCGGAVWILCETIAAAVETNSTAMASDGGVGGFGVNGGGNGAGGRPGLHGIVAIKKVAA